MTEYSTKERLIAKALENFPVLRTVVKETYKRLIYFFHREKGFQYSLHPSVTLQSAFAWAGLEYSEEPYFFGYYDKSPWSPDMSRMLLHQKKGDKLEIIQLDRIARSLKVIGTSSAWNWQQGAMAQWVQINGTVAVVHNTIQENILGMQVVDFDDSEHVKTQFIPWPVQTVHPRKAEALSINYKRLHLLRNCYGYRPKVVNFQEDMPDDADGIWSVNLMQGKEELIISLQQLKESHPLPEMKSARHKVNHLIYSPHGDRFVFLHRYYTEQGKFSRLYSASPDGTELNLLLDARMVSHYHWMDNDNIIAWARTDDAGDKYYKVNIVTNEITIIGENVLEKFGDGHCTVSPDGRYMLTDTYPDKARNQHLFIYDLLEEKMHLLGSFFSPWRYYEYNRCDLHPRWSPDSRFVSIDSVHDGKRKSYILQVEQLIRPF
uniref:hypothetical protein n=1 Tax=Candidatus Electrothrix sp. TaxID=2170559 RepID=UPI00405741F6